MSSGSESVSSDAAPSRRQRNVGGKRNANRYNGNRAANMNGEAFGKGVVNGRGGRRDEKERNENGQPIGRSNQRSRNLQNRRRRVNSKVDADGNAKPMNEQIESVQHEYGGKRYYFDIGKNDRGMYCKISQMRIGRAHESFFMPIVAFDEIAAHLESLLEESKKISLGSIKLDENDDRATVDLKTLTHLHGNRKYVISLKANKRGLFLRLMQISFTNYNTSAIFIPIETLPEVLAIAHGLLDKHYDADNEPVSDGFSHLATVGSKNFYFTCRENNNGRYIMISEIQKNYRSSIAIPEDGGNEFICSLQQCLQHFLKAK